MLNSILGPSGSDRRLFTLVALTIALMPAGSLIVKLAFDELSLYDVLAIGTMGTAVLMSVCVIAFGTVSMVVNGLRGQHAPVAQKMVV